MRVQNTNISGHYRWKLCKSIDILGYHSWLVLQVTPHSNSGNSTNGNGGKMPGLPAVTGPLTPGLPLNAGTAGAFSHVLPNTFNENNNIIHFGEEGKTTLHWKVCIFSQFLSQIQNYC